MKKMLPSTFLSAALLLAPLGTPAALAREPAVRSAPGMVSAADPRAAAAGIEILKAGGNATDAAIATMLALGVVEPQSSGMAGGSFWVRQTAGGGFSTIDARETAPMAANPHWFYTPADSPNGTPLSHRDAVPGGRSVGIPGALRGMALAHRDGGKLPWARLFEPAIRLARDGWVLTPRFVGGLASYGGHITPETRALFSGPDGKPLPAGATVRNPAQAALMERIATAGPDAFYTGAEAEKIVATVNGAARNPSKMTTADLAAYRAKPRPPVCTTYRTYKVCGMGPPSSGGVTVLMILKQLERFDMAKLGKDSPVAWHLFAESSRLAYADRDLYVGDPDFVRVPIAGMLSPAYLARRSALISPSRAIDVVTAGTPPGAPPRTRVPAHEVAGTTDLAVADRQGNVVEVTTTVEGVFGSGLSVDGTVLNNQLTDFDIVPDTQDGYLSANRVEGGKRPRSSMAPTIVYDAKGHVRLAVGAAGGPTIIAQVAKAIMGVIDFRMSAEDAIAMGLVFAPGPVVVEAGTEREAMAPAMRALGDKVQVAPLGLKANAVEWREGHWIGAADPRSEGVAIGEDGHMAEPIRRGRTPGQPAE